VNKKGIPLAIITYLLWGVFPIYFKTIQRVPPLEIIFHRVVWSFIILALITSFRNEWRNLRASVSNGRVATIYMLSAVLIGTNWLLYVWAVNSGHVVEASLGYFINPLFSVALGVLVIRERLRPLQWAPIGLAVLGVIYLAVAYGEPPWISLGLASTFSLYGMVKKVAPLSSMQGLTVETGVLFLPALTFLVFLGSQGTGSFISEGWSMSILLMGAGPATTIPLLLFATAARSLPLWLLGILQYIAPTLQFLLGVVIYKEGFSTAQMIGYGMIWLALAIFTGEAIVYWRKSLSVRTASI
jgi:chloramphenicol-sensitive protein RarD